MDSLSNLPWVSKASSPSIVKDEKLVLDTRHHWMKIVPVLCVYLFLLCLSLSLFLLMPSLRSSFPEISSVIFFGALIIVVLVQHWFFHAFLSEHATDIVLTNKRMLYLVHRLWVADSMDELVLQKIKMVEVHRNGIMQHMLNYGDLACLFDVGAGKVFLFVPRPQTWARHIERLVSIS